MSAIPASLRVKQRALARAQPLSAQLELTYRCNWRCVFCYNPRHADRRGLAGEEWAAVLDGLRRLGTLTVTLTGGEPLAHRDFLSVARGVRSRSLALRVFTNGSLVDDRMADALAELVPLAVELSLHGAEARVHDLATGRPGSFEAMCSGLQRLRARGVRTLLKVPLTRLNEDSLEEMIALAERLGTPLSVDPTITPRDDGDAGPLAYAPSRAAVERLYTRLARDGQLPGTRRTPGGVNCGLGRVTLCVDPEGDVFPCVQWRRRPLGNVREASLEEIWTGSGERRDAAAVATAANERLLAQGGSLADFPFCPALALQRTGDPLGPSQDHVRRAELAQSLRLRT